MHLVDAFALSLGLLMLLIGIHEKREALRIRRDLAEVWRSKVESETRPGN